MRGARLSIAAKDVSAAKVAAALLTYDPQRYVEPNNVAGLQQAVPGAVAPMLASSGAPAEQRSQPAGRVGVTQRQGTRDTRSEQQMLGRPAFRSQAQ